MLRGKIFLIFIFCLFISSVGYAATELDGDTNGGVDITKGGTNATDAAGARTALGLAIGTDVLAPNGNGGSLTNLTMGNIPIQEIGTATYDDLNEYLNTTGTAGFINGGLTVTDNGDGSVTVAAGSGYIRSSDSVTAQLYSFDIAQDVPTLTNNALNFIYVDYNSGTPVIDVTTDVTSISGRDAFVVGFVRKDDTSIHIGNAGQRLSCFKHALYYYSWEHDGLQRASGAILSETGTRNIAVSTGVFWLAYNRTTTSAFDSSGTDRFKAYYRDGVGGWTEVTDQSQIDNAYWDDNTGVLNDLTNTRYGVFWVFQMIDGDIYVMYGRGDYLLAQAQAATLPSDRPDELSSELSTFIGKIIIQQGASSFTSVTNPFTGSAIGLSAATDHGSLAGLTDDDHTQYGALAQDETITGNWVNTANPWADNEVSDTITVGASGSVNNSALDQELQDFIALTNTPYSIIGYDGDGSIEVRNNIATESFTTEADITDPLTAEIILLSGDNDSDSDTLDLQDGTYSGQTATFIAYSGIDSDDTCTISMTDTTCVNCPSGGIVFDSLGQSDKLAWNGSAWVYLRPQYYGTLTYDDESTALRTGTNTDDYFKIDAYDVDGSAYTPVVVPFAADDPGVKLGGDTNYLQITNAGVMTLGGSAALPTNSVGNTQMSDDAITMNEIDDDGNFTALTGNWATTGYLAGALRSEAVGDGSEHSIFNGLAYYDEAGPTTHYLPEASTIASEFGFTFLPIWSKVSGIRTIYPSDSGDHWVRQDGTVQGDGSGLNMSAEVRHITALVWDNDTFIVYSGDGSCYETP